MDIAIDVDLTIVETPKYVHQLYRLLTGDTSTIYDKDKLEWNLRDLCPMWNDNQITLSFSHPTIFKLMKPYNDAIEIMQILKERGHKLHLVTMHKPIGRELKQQWLDKHFPFVDSITILDLDDTDVTPDKNCVKADVIIDDRSDVILNHNAPIKICFGTSKWTKDYKGLRANDWNEVYKIILLYEGWLKK